MAQTLQNTINFALPFINYSPLTAGFGQEPATSIASMIRTSLLNAGVGPWYWNRANANAQLTKGQQDYLLFAEDFGYIEKCTVTDDEGKIWELKDVYNTKPLSASSEQQRPSAVSIEAGASGLIAGGTVATAASNGSGGTQTTLITFPIESNAGEGLFMATGANAGVTQGDPGNGWAANGFGVGNYTKASTGNETFSQTLSPTSYWSGVVVSFRMQVPGTAPVHVKTAIDSGFVSSPSTMTFGSGGTSLGSGILVVFQIMVLDTAFSNIVISDDKLNSYFFLGINQSGPLFSGTMEAVYWAPSAAQGTTVVTANFTGTGSGQVGAYEVSGVTSPLQNSPSLRFLGVPDQNYVANVIYQKRAIGFGPWFITSVGDVAGGFTTYQGSFDPQAFPAGSTANITGFETQANNGSFTVASISNIGLVLQNPNGAAETHAAFATNFSWAPIPDSYVDVYNNLFLSEALAAVDDARAQIYRQRGVSAFLSKAQGLTDEQKNAFVQQWLARSSENAASGLRVQQGMGARAS